MVPHYSTLAWKLPWMEEPGGLQSMGSQRVDTTERLHFHFSLSCIGEGNGNPLQCSCLENPRNGGACWAAVYGVAQSLKRLSSNSSNNRSLLVIYFELSSVFMLTDSLDIFKSKEPWNLPLEASSQGESAVLRLETHISRAQTPVLKQWVSGLKVPSFI